MKVIVTYRIYESRVGKDRFVRLASICPPRPPYMGTIELRLDEADCLVDQFLRVTREYGLRPGGDGEIDQSFEFFSYRRREYDSSDFEAAELLELRALDGFPLEIEFTGRPSNGQWGVFPHLLKKNVDFFGSRGGSSPFIAPERVVRLLNNASFRGLKFLPLLLLRRTKSNRDHIESIPWDTLPEPWRLLSSDIVLPPVSPYLSKRSTKGELLPRDARRAALIESGYNDRELHYLRSELNAIDPFDFATIYENETEAGPLVVSRRVYEFFKANNLRCSWRPVRIDEG